jgi:two-component system chemotaxis response regulator CheB
VEQLKRRIKVLVVDDSALVREILAQGLGMDPDIEVVGAASNPYMARDKIVQLKPDVLTLDVEMPRMDGVEFLRRLMPQYPLPVVMVSALTGEGAKTTLEALEAGAVDYVAKPSSDIARGLDSMMNKLREKVKMAATANLREWKGKKTAAAARLHTVSGTALAESTDKVIAIGASTGGTRAIRQIIQSFPASMPGVVIVQHMPAGFTRHFADNLNDICEMEVLEASTNDRIMPGRIIIAPGGKHMTVRRSGGVYMVECKEGEKVNGHCPSVDVLFHSVAGQVGSNAIGVVLTGMGHDGADGLLAMRNNGARTLAQDEASSVVFGMPKVAYERGGAEFLNPLNTIPQVVMNLLHDKKY